MVPPGLGLHLGVKGLGGPPFPMKGGLILLYDRFVSLCQKAQELPLEKLKEEIPESEGQVLALLSGVCLETMPPSTERVVLDRLNTVNSVNTVEKVDISFRRVKMKSGDIRYMTVYTSDSVKLFQLWAPSIVSGLLLILLKLLGRNTEEWEEGKWEGS